MQNGSDPAQCGAAPSVNLKATRSTIMIPGPRSQFGAVWGHCPVGESGEQSHGHPSSASVSSVSCASPPSASCERL